MKFVDEAKIEVSAGKGGAGSCHFRREKYVAMGGPDGGNGGAGGSVILVADQNTQTLLDFKFKPQWKAQDGDPGDGNLKDGSAGQDLIINVPVGTEVFTQTTNELVTDLNEHGQRFVLAKGGRGGKGNTFFKSATNQAPRHTQPGEEGEFGSYLLSLKLVADVGLLGFPNAGKSTLISRISAAKPKIADYPFTTLTPNLGVVKAKGKNTFIVADIPGLIPDAHLGKGLGIKFLKHVERTRILIHLLDPFHIDENGEQLTPFNSYNLLNTELANFSSELAAKEQIVVISKSDTISETDRKVLAEEFQQRDIPCYFISSVKGEGLEELIELTVSKLKDVS